MKNENWDDLRLFFLVATEGGLTAASKKAAMSAATLGRRMQALERATGRELFIRHQTGYELAPDGQSLLDRVKAMQMQAQDIQQWRDGPYELPFVSISSDHWMGHFLASHLARIWTSDDPFRICLKTAQMSVDLSHRQADIGISSDRPQTVNLAGRKSVEVAYAPFCAVDLDQDRNQNWVALGSDVSFAAADLWVLSQPDLWISTWANAPRLVFDLIKNSAGRAILPCYIGDHDPDLVRAGPVIDALSHSIWMTMHDDDRHRSEVRTLIERVAALLSVHQRLFAGLADEPASYSAAF